MTYYYELIIIRRIWQQCDVLLLKLKSNHTIVFSFPCRLLPCHSTSILLRLADMVAMKTRLALARHGGVGAARYFEDAATLLGEDLGTYFAIWPKLSLLVLCIILELIWIICVATKSRDLIFWSLQKLFLADDGILSKALK
jgi:hypothetical protein